VSIPGQFISDSTLETNLAANFAADKGVVRVAMSDGTTVFGVIQLPPASASTPTPAPTAHGTNTPATPAVPQNVGDSSVQSNGTKIQIQDQVLLTLGGHQTIRVDTTVTNTTTNVVTTVRHYIVVMPNERILIDIETSAVPSPLGLFESALLKLPNSSGPAQ
jgi:hypothetical protein